MKRFLNKVVSFIKKRGSISLMFMIILFSASFFAISTFGLQNSSLCIIETQADIFKTNTGSDIRMRLYLSDESEGRRKSVIKPVNSYNDYRLSEFGRCASYVLDKQFNISFDSGNSISNQILYADYYSEYYTTNRINLVSTKFDKETFYDGHSIYLTRSIVDQIPDLTAGTVIGQKVRLSLDSEEEYIVRGVIEYNSYKNNGKHFSKLFSDRFVVLPCAKIYQYDFTDLIFQSQDYYFVDDFVEFEKVFSKTYLNFNSIELRTSSVIETDIKLSDVFTIPSSKTSANILFSVASIFALVIITILYLFTFMIYDFNSLLLSEKIIVCIVFIIWAFAPMVFGLVMMMRSIYLSRIVISLLIGYAAISSAIAILKFSFFKNKEKEEVENNG